MFVSVFLNSFEITVFKLCNHEYVNMVLLIINLDNSCASFIRLDNVFIHSLNNWP